MLQGTGETTAGSGEDLVYLERLEPDGGEEGSGDTCVVEHRGLKAEEVTARGRGPAAHANAKAERARERNGRHVGYPHPAGQNPPDVLLQSLRGEFTISARTCPVLCVERLEPRLGYLWT